MVRMNFLKDPRTFRQMELRVFRLDANKETVRRCVGKARNVENRMVRLGQFVEGQHTENRGERSAENGQFKGDGNEGRPAIEGAAADVHGIGGFSHPVLEEKTPKTPSPATKQAKSRDPAPP